MMEGLNITSGKWTKLKRKAIVIAGEKESDDYCEIIIKRFLSDTPDKFAHDNARLIARAPEMFDFLLKAARLDEISDPEEYEQCTFLLNQHAKELVSKIITDK